MRIQLLGEKDRERWTEFVHASKDSTCYHQLGWKNVIEKSFGHKTYYFVCEDERGNLAGILPVAHLKSALFGSFLISLPYFNYGGICANGQEASDKLLEEVIRIGNREKAEYIELRETRFLDNSLKVRESKVSMQLPLPPEAKELWAAFDSKLKSQINRPKKEGMRFKMGREEELDGFYRVFSINMRDLGTPVYSKKFFRNILEEFPQTSWICTVYAGEEPVASGFMVGFKERLEIPWASSIRSFNRYGPNMLLYWTILEFACNRRFKVFDFGRSTAGEGTYRFKEQWGARPVSLKWHYWMPEGRPLPEVNVKNPKYRSAIQIWKKLPVGFTRILGPAIVKNLP